MEDLRFLIKTEHEIAPLRFADMDCPYCGKSIDLMCDGRTEQGGSIHDSVDLCFIDFSCPHCGMAIKTRDREVHTLE